MELSDKMYLAPCKKKIAEADLSVMEWEVLESEGLCGNKKTLSCATNRRAEDREGLYFAVRKIDGPLKVIGNYISKRLHDQSQAPSLKGNRFRVVMFRKTLRRC